MRYNKLGLIALMAMLAVLLVPVVFAVDAITWRNPSSATQVMVGGSNKTSEIKLNITTSGNVNISNCSFWFYSTDTNESVTSPVLIVVNSTGNQTNTTTVNATEWTANYSAQYFQDTINGVLNASCESYNVSANTPVSATQSFRNDHSVPETPTSVRPADKERQEKSDKTMSFSAAVDARNSTGCYVQFSGRNPGTSIYATGFLGATATNCTVTIANFPEGTYQFQYFATDGINSTPGFSGYREVTVNYFSGASKVGYVQATQQQGAVQQQAAKQSNAKTLIIIIAIVIVITQIMKKGKRR